MRTILTIAILLCLTIPASACPLSAYVAPVQDQYVAPVSYSLAPAVAYYAVPLPVVNYVSPAYAPLPLYSLPVRERFYYRDRHGRLRVRSY